MRKDQKRRLKYQELQRIKQQAVNTPVNNPFCTSQQSKGDLEKFASKLVR